MNDKTNSKPAAPSARETAIKIIESKYGNDKNSKKAQEELAKLIKLLQTTTKEITKSAKQLRKEEREERRAASQEAYNIQMNAATNASDRLKASMNHIKEGMADSLNEGLENAMQGLADAALDIGNKVGEQFDDYASTFSQYQSAIDTRLQGSDTTFKSLEKLVRKNLAASTYLKQEKMLESLNSLIEEGVAYNIEQRAYLQAMQDKLVTTFDAFDSNLLRIIRLQQSDSTVARMGMEAQLTKYLNAMFQDTYYLSNVFDSVSQSIFELTSQLDRDTSVELEYTLQKWLGSMSALGVGDSTLTTIAEMINALGTGNVETLSGNTGMQNLIVTAANRSGMSYSGLLTEGLNVESVDKLMRGIVDYIQEIAVTENQVVRSQYANLFGVTLSDMTAIMNLTTKDLESISRNMLSYSQAINQTEELLSTVGKRMHIKTQIDNIFDNISLDIYFFIFLIWKEDAVDGQLPTSVDTIKARQSSWT